MELVDEDDSDYGWVVELWGGPEDGKEIFVSDHTDCYSVVSSFYLVDDSGKRVNQMAKVQHVYRPYPGWDKWRWVIQQEVL